MSGQHRPEGGPVVKRAGQPWRPTTQGLSENTALSAALLGGPTWVP